jgi:small-conductance mechanosensitive channel
MLFELLKGIQWMLWFDRILCATAIFVFITIIVWVVPIFINYLLAVAAVHPQIRQGTVMILRLIIVVSGTFILGDALGFTSDVVFAVLGTVFGVGISWAIKDNVSNALSGMMLFVFQSYGLGDEIASSSGSFKGVIRSFHLQFVTLQNTETGQITYVPNSMLWTTVINITYQKIDPCSLNRQQASLASNYLNV